MTLQLKQNLKLSQQLIMTPQLQQAIKLLQLSRLELVETVQQALQENPLLEEISPEEISGGEEREGDNSTQKEKEILQAIKIDEKNLLKNAEWEDYLGYFSSSSKTLTERELPEEAVNLESFCASKPSLESHLMWQLHLSKMSKEEIAIGEVIIKHINSSGYLDASIEEIATICKTKEKKVEKILKKIQQFDPVGVGSRNLKECLIEQLKFLKKDYPPLINIIENHLEDLENQDYKKIAEKLEISIEEMLEYVEIIKGLDPKPGNNFNEGQTFYISPDAYVFKHDNEFIIILNDDGFSNIKINQYYLTLTKKNEKDKQYIDAKLKEALWLIKSIHQRQSTLYKVIESIVKFQREFFEKGVPYLKPLVLRDVADDIDVHESTVSRLTTNKYISTPHGIFELKYFFNSGLNREGGGEISAESVKHFIKKLINEENPKSPLSDKKIAEILKEKFKIKIARRTVAKYREALGIPSSSKRKKLF